MQTIRRLLLITVALVAMGTTAFGLDLTNRSAQVFQKVTVTEARPDGLKVMHSKGVAFIPFTELPEAIQREYNYDPEKEKAYLKDAAQQRQQQAAQRAQAELLDTIKKAGKLATLRIIQITEGGALATGYYSDEEESQDTRRRENRYALPDRIFVVGIPSHLVDDDRYRTMIYPCGRYQYTTVMGGGATVERYATNPRAAMDIALGRQTVQGRRVGGDRDPTTGSGLKGFGSGFLISKDGYLLTNHHVVKGARQIKVKTEKALLPARLVAQDSDNDVALLKVEGEFTPVTFAADKIARLGQTVFTVGFPMPELQGFAPKVTKGVISSLKGIEDDVRTYQIDAAVQPGNSGGPLADESGNIVGVIAARLNDGFVLQATGGIAQNVNYAVKKSYAVAFLDTQPDAGKQVQTASESKVGAFEEAVEKVRKATVLVIVY